MNEQLKYKTKTTARNWELRDQGFSQGSVILKTLKWIENGCDIKNLFLHPVLETEDLILYPCE